MKTSFNYLLLDPRVTNNLAERARNMSTIEKLRVFFAAVFYIGKGKKSRPYEHLYEAIKVQEDDTGTRVCYSFNYYRLKTDRAVDNHSWCFLGESIHNELAKSQQLQEESRHPIIVLLQGDV